jgi:hypothetical protein
MAKNPYHMRINGSDMYMPPGRDLNVVTHAPGGGHLHTVYDGQGNIVHTDYTFSSGVKVPVNPNLAPSLAAFLSGGKK